MSSSEDEGFGEKRLMSRPTYTKEETDALRKLFTNRFYTAERLQHWVGCEKALNEEPFEATITTFDVDGKSEDIKAKGPNKRIILCSYNQFLCPREDQPPAADEQFAGKLVRVGKAWPVPKPEKCCAKADFAVKMPGLVRQWVKSDFYSQMRRYIEKFAPRMVEVKSVACFGLGRLKLDPDLIGRHAGACYLQHYAAVRIRDCIAEAQRKPKEDIPIYAQDPAYCANCKTILKTKLGITVVPGNSGYLKVDGNTFVVSISPAAPVRQIVADITKDTKGPAGMLCDIIHNDGVCGSNGVVDMSHPELESEFLHGTAKREMKMEMKEDPRAESDEDQDDSNFQVEYDGEVLPGSVFGPIGWYFKDKKIS